MKRLASFFLPAILVLTSLPAWAQNGANQAAPATGPGYGPGYGPMWGYGHHYWGDGWGWGFHPFGLLFFIILCIFLIAVVLRMFGFGRHYGRRYFHHAGYGPSGSALDILEERFARGEIDKNEFEEKRKLLMR
jgi:putative membrane protein